MKQTVVKFRGEDNSYCLLPAKSRLTSGCVCVHHVLIPMSTSCAHSCVHNMGSFRDSMCSFLCYHFCSANKSASPAILVSDWLRGEIRIYLASCMVKLRFNLHGEIKLIMHDEIKIYPAL